MKTTYEHYIHLVRLGEPKETEFRALDCLSCGQTFTYDRETIFEGQPLKCLCGHEYTVYQKYGIMEISQRNVIGRAMQLLRFLDARIKHRDNSSGYELIYFNDEQLADQYSDTLRIAGPSIGWHGGKVVSGRAPDQDLIIDDIELYAVSR